MAKGISVHVGVDTAELRTAAFERDARAMADLAGRFGYQVAPPLLGGNAGLAEVRRELNDAVGKIQAGDTLLLTFSTHGKSNQAKSEYLSLPNGVLTDRELYEEFLCRLPEGSRAVLVVDACASEGIASPWHILEKQGAGSAWAKLHRVVGSAARRLEDMLGLFAPAVTFGGGPRPVDDLAAEVHELAAALKGENAMTTGSCGGMSCFTYHLVQRMREPPTPLTYGLLVAELAEGLRARGQTPTHHPYGPGARAEAASRAPFVI